MWKKRRPRTSVVRPLTAALLLALARLSGAAHHGQVTFGGLPVPGATVTASQGDKKVTAVTDPQGVYSFHDLPDGTWTLQIEMLCFAPIKQEVAIAPGAPASEWQLKMLPLEELKRAALPAAAPVISIVRPETRPAKPGKASVPAA